MLPKRKPKRQPTSSIKETPKRLKADSECQQKEHFKTEILTHTVEDEAKLPLCVHGPALLFQKRTQENYYTCSAYRDGKSCHFYHPADKPVTQSLLDKWAGVKRMWAEEQEKKIVKSWKSKLETDNLCADEKRFCQTCSQFFAEKGKEMHQNHKLKQTYQVSSQICVLEAKSANKKEAQYHFTSKTVNVLINNIKHGGFDKVLCIGVPRLSEEIKKSMPRVKSLLLDIDIRLGCLFEPAVDWCWYNLCNHHFFLPKHEKRFLQFLESPGKLLVITDPPFGVRVELVASTLRKIGNSCPGEPKLNVMWIFPYFMESKIVSECPELKMSDFQVEYDNHDSFHANHRGSKGSPVRIFTNLPNLLDLGDLSNLYKFCDMCQIWVSKVNSHCFDCGFCTAKDGSSYRHCKICKRCVKKTWFHCKKCNRCALSQHPCQLFRNKLAKKNNLN